MNLFEICCLGLGFFAMIALNEIFKLKKEVRKLNKISQYLLDEQNNKKT